VVASVACLVGEGLCAVSLRPPVRIPGQARHEKGGHPILAPAAGSDLLWCAADAHLSGGDPALSVFLDWLRSFEEAGVQTLVLLGDLFRV
jgi:hypothetical protein